tara:strand:+ start:733 stop:987 length:255 start_codon:yes stop_codon:yes gene_type:complete
MKTLQHINTATKFTNKTEMAWITFNRDNEWEQVWFKVEMNGKHLKWDSEFIMEIARERWGDAKFSFGIASTSQMLLNNACRDNF